MAPDARASAAAMARLLAEVRADRVALRARLADGAEARRRLGHDPTDPGAQALAGVAIHAWYTGVECVFERVARQIDGAVPTGERWHRDLAFQATAAVPGLRPPLVPAEAMGDLLSLLAFRHFFRHAYAVTFESNRLLEELDHLDRASGPVEQGLDGFEAFLRAALDELALL